MHKALPFAIYLLTASASVSATQCFGAVFDTVSNAFQYRAHLNVTGVECSDNSTRITTLFMAGACGKGHENNFDGRPPHCASGDWNILNASSSTCEKVFDEASLQDLRTPNGSQIFDEGKICNNGIKGVVFVETNCSSLNASSVVLKQRPIADEYCWDGRTLSHNELAGIIIGAVVGFGILVSTPVLIFFCLKRRKLKRQRKEVMLQEIEGRNLSSSVMFRNKGTLGTDMLTPPPVTYLEDFEEDGPSNYDIELEDEYLGTSSSQHPARSFTEMTAPRAVS